jgi:hypothetical protein
MEELGKEVDSNEVERRLITEIQLEFLNVATPTAPAHHVDPELQILFLRLCSL